MTDSLRYTAQPNDIAFGPPKDRYPWLVIDHGESRGELIPVAYSVDEAHARQYAADLNEIGYVIVEDESGAVA